jgi:hypothetical protein
VRLIVLVAFVTGCAGTTADPGLGAHVRIAGAQYVEGAMPAPTGALAVTAIDSLNNGIWQGQVGKALSGRVAGAAQAVAIGFPDDAGYWIVVPGAADLNVPGELTWSAKASFASDLAVGPHELAVAAIDAQGKLGTPATLSLTVRARQLDVTDTTLAISLRWDTEADLDLHVVVPGDPPVIVWSGNLNSYTPPPPGEPVDPMGPETGGILDYDSNSQCAIDGRREENVVWRGALATPPSGEYAVLVDTFSLCAATTAHWDVDVFVAGVQGPHAEGTVTDGDTRGGHVASSGIRALEFTY